MAVSDTERTPAHLAPEPAAPAPRPPVAEGPRWPWALALVWLLAAAFVLRVWGARHGLPYAYNADENAHFVPKAIGLFGHGWNPHYFVNPPAYTYVLHVVFDVWFGGREGVSSTYARDPTQVFLVARVVSATLGTAAVGLLYLAGARLFDRRVGLLAAALLTVSFLPVFYSHLALNDVPTLMPICLALWGIARVIRGGTPRDYALAGAGFGLACAFKYTGGIVVLPLIAAIGAQLLRPELRGAAARGALIAAGAAIVAFLVANPYSLLAFDEFKEGLVHQSTAADDAAGKLGTTQDSGLFYYLWSLTWGLGYVPALAALATAAGYVAKRRWGLSLLLIPGPVLFLLFMGSQARFFGRWIIPIMPLLCLLAAAGAFALIGWAARERPRLAPWLTGVVALVLLGQGIVTCLHIAVVLNREDTRNTTREWLVANVPARTKIVVEPVVPDSWAQDIGHPLPTGNGNRWNKFPTSRSNRANDGSAIPGDGRIVNIEDYERTLYPSLIDRYEEREYCYVITGSTQRGRAEAQPELVPDAIAYYRALERRSRVVHEASPWGEEDEAVPFNFDFSFDYYPLQYQRPGALMTVYRLTGGNCRQGR